MDPEDIDALRRIEDKDKAIILIREGINALEDELAPVLSALKDKNKCAYIDLLTYRMETLNELLAYCVKFLSDNFTQETTLNQAILEGNLMKTIEEI